MGREMPDMSEGHGDQSFSFLFLGSDLEDFYLLGRPKL